MVTLTIRNIDDSVRDALKEIARSNGRSLESQVRYWLTRAVHEATSAKSTVEEPGFGTQLANHFNGIGEQLMIPARNETAREIDFS
jgi:plasmid stability protein